MGYENAGSAGALDHNLMLELDSLDLGISLGYHVSKDEILECRQFPEDRLQHTWFLGKTGTGKSNLIENAVMQDINQGNGATLIDPHGSTADRVLARIPPWRANDVVLADFSNTECLPIINPLDIDPHDEAGKALSIQTLNALIYSRMPEGFYGPRGEEMMRLRLKTIMDPGYPYKRCITEVEALSIDKTHLDKALKSIKSKRLLEQWNLEKLSERDNDWHSIIHWFLSKIHEWVSDPTLRFFLSGGKTTVNIGSIIEGGKILIVKIPEATVGTSVADFIGSFFVALIKNAIMKRRCVGNEPLRKHYVYIDEFQRFATPDFAVLLAEARKFGCGFVLANQNMRQLVRPNRQNGSFDNTLIEAVLANVGTIVCFRIGPNDARVIADHFEIALDAVRNIGRYKAIVRQLFDNRQLKPVVVSVPLAPKAIDDAAAVQIRKRMADEGVWQQVSSDKGGKEPDKPCGEEVTDSAAGQAGQAKQAAQTDSTASISWDDLDFLKDKRAVGEQAGKAEAKPKPKPKAKPKAKPKPKPKPKPDDD
jgi:hypothetical protein